MPGIVLATVFITFPFVARELIPFVMQATGTDQGASRAHPSGPRLADVLACHVACAGSGGLLIGIILCNARRWRTGCRVGGQRSIIAGKT